MKTNEYLTVYWMILLSVGLIGCSTSSQQVGGANDEQRREASTVGHPTDGMARVVFKRHANMVGALVTHFVVDRGEGIIRNAVVFQKQTFSDREGNFDKMGNVKQLYFKFDDKRSRLMAGTHLQGDIFITTPWSWGRGAPSDQTFTGTVIETRRDPIGDSVKEYFGTIHRQAYWENSQSLVPNAQLAGVGGLRPGQTVSWDRPAGIMKIEVITEGGDQAFSPPFKVEAGRTYFVDYYYMRADFKVSESK